jgi:uncharacterized protein
VLTSIHIYPLKGGRGLDLSESAVHPWGLAGDRRWMLADQNGRFISQREHTALARLDLAFGPGGALLAAAAGHAPLTVPVPDTDLAEGDLVKVTVWEAALLATGAGPEADAWFSAYLGAPARLVYLDDPTRRAVDPGYGQPGDVVNFADGFPLLLTSTSSLEQLGDWLTADGDQPVPMNRFRPNVVVTGFEPWAEDRWHRIRIGDVPFRVAKPCGRCVVTTTDQVTGERGRQPLRMLARHRRFGQELVFGQNLIPEAPGTPGRLRVGDPVEITEYAR